MGSLSIGSWMSGSGVDSSNPQVVEYVLDSLISAASDYDEKERAEEKARLMKDHPEKMKKLVDLLCVVMSPAGIRWRGQMNDHFRQQWDMQLPFDKISCPTLLIHGIRWKIPEHSFRI